MSYVFYWRCQASFPLCKAVCLFVTQKYEIFLNAFFTGKGLGISFRLMMKASI